MESIRWRCNHHDPSSWRCWDEEHYLVFNSGSAQTHQLNQFATDILALLKIQPLALPELISHLTHLYENIETDAEIAAYFQQTIQLLDEIGLIEPDTM